MEGASATATRPHDVRWWLAGSAGLTLALAALRSRILVSDAFFDLFSGRYIVQHGLPHHDVVTVAAHGHAWIDQQWLAHVVFYGAWNVGGYPLTALLSAALITTAFTLLAAAMIRRGAPPARAFRWTAAATIVCFANMAVRAQSFAYVCFALVVWLLVEDDRAPEMRHHTFLVVPVVLLWANTHGSVLLGAGVIAAYGVSRIVTARRRGTEMRAMPYAALVGATLVAALTTPYGVRIVGYYADITGNRAIARNVTEWARPRLTDAVNWPYFILLVVLVVVAARAARRGALPSPALLIPTLLLVGLSFTAVRFEIWAATLGAVLAASRPTGSTSPATIAATARTVAVGVAVALGAVATIALLRTGDDEFESAVPTKALDAAARTMAARPGSRVISDSVSATALLWLHPSAWGRVAFDVRFEQYGERELTTFADWVKVRGATWPKALDGYDLVVVSRTEKPKLARAMQRLDGWRETYHDADGAVFEREGSR